MPADHVTCARCGGSVAAHLSFCTHCGSPLASAVPPAAPPSPPTVAHPAPPPTPPAYVAPPPAYGVPLPPPQPPRRRRGGLVAVWLVLAVLLLGGAVTAGVLLLDREPEGTSSLEDADDRDREPTEEPSPEAPEETQPSASVSPEPSPPPRVRCWDGSSADRLVDCTSPTGRRGIRWVFPSLTEADCSPGDAKRLQIWNCYDYLDDGTAIRFNYSEWDNFASAAVHYRNPGTRDGFSETLLPDGRIQWLSYDLAKAQYKAALAYERAPWSVTIYADTEAHRAAAVRELLVMRPRDQLRGIG